MDIYAKNGHKLVVTEEGVNNGYDHDKAHAAKHLIVGKTYTVDFTEVGSWHTNVYLKEIPNVPFNSVHFENAQTP